MREMCRESRRGEGGGGGRAVDPGLSESSRHFYLQPKILTLSWEGVDLPAILFTAEMK